MNLSSCASTKIVEFGTCLVKNKNRKFKKVLVVAMFKNETSNFITEIKIIWSTLTESTDPEGVNKLSKDITKVVYKQMLKDGIIK